MNSSVHKYNIIKVMTIYKQSDFSRFWSTHDKDTKRRRKINNY